MTTCFAPTDYCDCENCAPDDGPAFETYTNDLGFEVWDTGW